MKRLNWLSVLVVCWSFVACTTTNDGLYKTMATTEATVDKAMNSWGAYVNFMTCQAGYDKAAFDKKQAEVKRLYTSYRTAMNSAYEARATFVTSQGAGATAWQSAVAAAQTAAANLTTIIDLWVKPLTTL